MKTIGHAEDQGMSDLAILLGANLFVLLLLAMCRLAYTLLF